MELFSSKGPKETIRLAKILAREVIKAKPKIKKSLIFGLVGELGAGKTTFIKAFARGFGIRKRLTSPSFVLMKKYKNFYHIDCYRIKTPEDILALDFKEIISNPKNIVLIEWA
ncbi:MAG: tRNA (adenosine(37)-N6)-threonylcarbamoyltransferase complex ATPase subunit type 1 TsaE, partial [Patescibacteria group bacterium]